jgi:uncharacterized protein (TIGR02271 family)
MLKIGGERRRAPLVTTADLVSKGKQRMLERDEAYVVPLAAERLVVGKREIVTGTVRVRTTVETREEPVDLMLAREAVEVERREVGRFVDEPPPVRQEGDLVIIPVVEEVLVVERRLRLTEELVIRRSRTEKRHHETVTLRRERAVVEREPAAVQDLETLRTGSQE